MYKILFVCTGNICRSPTAEGVLRHHIRRAGLTEKLAVASAGTHAYHSGENPDPRSVAAAKKRGIEIGHLRARKIIAADFQRFNLILGLDNENMQHLRRMTPHNPLAHTSLFLEYAGVVHASEVPDPYYGDTRDFDHVLDLIEEGAKPLLGKVKQQLTM